MTEGKISEDGVKGDYSHTLTLRHSGSSSTQSITSDKAHFTEINKHIKRDYFTRNVGNALCILLNVISAVGVVATNKIVFAKYNFRFGALLTTIHFATTSFILFILSHSPINFFQPKYQPISKILPLSMAFCGFVVLTNTSLVHNSVGFYQMAKVLTTPCVAILQFILHGQLVGWRVSVALIVTCFGVMVSTFTQVDLTLIGVVIALIAVLITSLYQVWVGSKQRELDLNAMQLLYLQSQISTIILTVTLPFLHHPIVSTINILFHHQHRTALLLTILMSSLMAVLVNISTFLVIGRTSAITYNMVGHGKLALVLLCGYLFFDNENSLGLGNLIGIVITFIGILTYSHLTTKK